MLACSEIMIKYYVINVILYTACNVFIMLSFIYFLPNRSTSSLQMSCHQICARPLAATVLTQCGFGVLGILLCNIYIIFISLWPSDTIWWNRSGSTLAQIMACCSWHQVFTLPEVTSCAWRHQAINQTDVNYSSVVSCSIHMKTMPHEMLYISLWCEFQNYKFKITATSLRGKWINEL